MQEFLEEKCGFSPARAKMTEWVKGVKEKVGHKAAAPSRERERFKFFSFEFEFEYERMLMPARMSRVVSQLHIN